MPNNVAQGLRMQSLFKKQAIIKFRVRIAEQNRQRHVPLEHQTVAWVQDILEQVNKGKYAQ